MKRSSIFWRLAISEIVYNIITAGVVIIVGLVMLNPDVTIHDRDMIGIIGLVGLGLLFILKICTFWVHADDIYIYKNLSDNEKS